MIEPWIFQRPVTEYSMSGRVRPLQDGDIVLLRDAESGGFLTVEEEQSVLDRLFLAETKSDRRFEVRCVHLLLLRIPYV
jgi:hypothetical protein